ncbi:MAG: circadian clock protein KaiC [Euryarchaeota archaeon]|nr:circadian clock protein KaiC [Euryarchaeota archaeon]
MGDDRVRTYIEGLDERMEGGIPNGSAVLVVGEPGTMKSSVTFNILYNNAMQDGRKSLYITLEQNAASLAKQMKGFGWDPKAAGDKIEILDIGAIRKRMKQEPKWMFVFKTFVKNLKDSNKYDILVIDSLPVLEVLAKFEEPRDELFQLFEWLRDMGLTTFLISEMSPDSRAYARYDEDFLSDGIMHLRMREMGGVSVQRHIRCVKMRSTNHSTDYFSLLFDKGQFKATRVIGDGRI